jgi:hypothetical protein
VHCIADFQNVIEHHHVTSYKVVRENEVQQVHVHNGAFDAAGWSERQNLRLFLYNMGP